MTVYPSVVSPFGGIPAIAMVSFSVAFLAYRYRGAVDETGMITRRAETAVIIILTISAFLLRGPGIGSTPPGLWVDEAVEGLQAGSAMVGEKLPYLPESNVVYPRWPVWWVLERVAVHFGGMSVSAIRLPAVIVGTLTVPLAWLVTRSLFGPLAGLVSASFLAFSFWHIQISRIAVAPVLLVPELLLAFWFLFSRGIKRYRIVGIAAGILGIVSSLGYPASLALTVYIFFVAMGRIFFPEKLSVDRAFGFWILAGIGAVVLMLSLVPGIHLAERMGRINSVGLAPIMDMVAQGVRCVVNHFVSVASPGFIWDGFPPGAPRFSPVENIAWLSGIAGIFVVSGLALGTRLALLMAFPVLLLPEILPGTSGGIYLVRGVASVGLISVLAGLGARMWGPAVGRAGLGVVLVVSAVSAWHSAGMTYGAFAGSDLSKRIYSSVAGEVADGIRGLAADRPVAVFPPLSYADNPQIAFHLWNEIRAGKVTMAANPPREDRAIAVYRDPAGKQPLVILVVSRNFVRDRIVGLLDVQGTMRDGQMMEMKARLREAEDAYRLVSRLIPDYPQAQRALKQVVQKARK